MVIIKTRPLFRGPRIKRWLWLAVLSGYAGYFGYLLASGRLEDLVSPRMTLFVVFGLAALLLMAGVQLSGLIRGAPASPLKGGFVLLLAPFAFLPLSLNPNSAILATNRGVSLEQGGPAIDLTTKLQAAVNPFLPKPKPKPVPKNGVVPASGTIVLDQKNYYPAYQELYANPGAFAGRAIHATGFVYRDRTEPADQFIMAREMMWCCAADAVAIGFISQTPHTGALKESEWVSVTGRLATTSYVDRYSRVKSTVPLIVVDHIEYLKGPDFAFVYPK